MIGKLMGSSQILWLTREMQTGGATYVVDRDKNVLPGMEGSNPCSLLCILYYVQRLITHASQHEHGYNHLLFTTSSNSLALELVCVVSCVNDPEMKLIARSKRTDWFGRKTR